MPRGALIWPGMQRSVPAPSACGSLPAVTAAAVRSREPLALLLLGSLMAVAIGIRVPAIDLPGHSGDVLVVSRWAERMAAVGPLGFYDGGGSIYPALLYAYWPLGVAFDGEALDLAIKALSIPFDAAIGVLLFELVSRRAGGLAGVGAAALYLLNPAVVLAGPVWGQIDAAGTLAFLATLVAAAAGRFGIAGALAMLAGLVKPQFGLVLLPVLVLAALEWRRQGRWEPMARGLSGAIAAYLLVAGPLLLSPIEHLSNIGGVTEIRPEASVLAPNMWALLVGYGVPDTGYTELGGALLLVGLAAAQVPLWRSRDLRTLLAVGAFVIFAFYFLPTRVHERYLFPAMAVLAPLAAVSRPVLAAYLAMAAGFALSLLYALVDTTSFTLPQAWEEVLLSDPMVWGMGITLMGAAITLVVQLSAGAGRRLESTSDD